MSIDKTKIVFDFDADSLKELRKVLFSKGLKPQQFITYIVELVSLRDPRIEKIMEEAVANKDIHRGKSRAVKADAETIYELIKRGLDNRKENGAENDKKTEPCESNENSIGDQ